MARLALCQRIEHAPAPGGVRAHGPRKPAIKKREAQHVNDLETEERRQWAQCAEEYRAKDGERKGAFKPECVSPRT